MTIRAGVPGFDGYPAVAAGAIIGALVAVLLHALEHGGSIHDVRAALTATLDRLEPTSGEPRPHAHATSSTPAATSTNTARR